MGSATDMTSENFFGPEALADLPRDIFDPSYCGPEEGSDKRCHHDEVPERKVAFDMADTGRKFLGFRRKGSRRCSYVFWVDDPWDPVLTRALINLWGLVMTPGSGYNSSDGGEIKMDQAVVDFMVEKNRENKLKLRELKMKELIRSNSEKYARKLNICANFCVASFSVAVTLAAIVAFLLIKKA